MRDFRPRGEIAALLISSAAGRRKQLLGVAVWSLIEAAPVFLSGRLVAEAVDHGFLVHRPSVGLAWLSALGAAVFVGGWATRQIYPQLAGLVEPFRDRLAQLTVSSALRKSTVPGGRADTSAVARLTRQVEIAREAYASLLAVVQGFLVATVSALVGLASLVPAALLFVVPPLVISLGIFVGSLRRLEARQRDSILADEGLSRSTTQLVESRRDIVACGGEEIVESGLSRDIQAQASATSSLARLTAVRNLAISIGGLLPVVFVLLGGPWLLRHGATTGTLLGALTYLLSGVHPALQTLVRGLGPSSVWLLVSLRRILEAADGTDLARSASAGTGTTSRRPAFSGYRGLPGGVCCDIRLQEVSFGYGSAPEPILQDFDLTLLDGDHVAVVGPSGIGKSTLAELMSGLLQPQSGQVLLGGVSLDRISPARLARLRVLVPEEAYVFSGSVKDNLTYLRRRVPRGELDEAVDLLGAGSLVERLGGYRAHLDPSVLSDGERQLISLVRSYLAPGRLVILDEATCHLDSQAEDKVERAFARRPGTLIVIAHRMTSALRARRIMVMDGDSNRLGTHDLLLRESDLYRDLVGRWVGVEPSAKQVFDLNVAEAAPDINRNGINGNGKPIAETPRLNRAGADHSVRGTSHRR